MTIVSDFSIILDDSSRVEIGDGSNENGFTESFDTTGRTSNNKAFISFMVKGMTVTTDSADVFVNDVRVGALYNNNGGRTNEWQTQIITFNGSVLANGTNSLRVSTVPNPTGGTNDHFDNYQIQSVICHFHQSV